jgi:hypothetical protein
MKVDKKVYYALGLIGVGFLLLRNPRCNRGCKTVAQHLIADGESGLVSTLFG